MKRLCHFRLCYFRRGVGEGGQGDARAFVRASAARARVSEGAGEGAAFAEALAMIEPLLERHPDDASGHVVRAEALAGLARPEAALAASAVWGGASVCPPACPVRSVVARSPKATAANSARTGTGP